MSNTLVCPQVQCFYGRNTDSVLAVILLMLSMPYAITPIRRTQAYAFAPTRQKQKIALATPATIHPSGSTASIRIRFIERRLSERSSSA